MPGGLLWLLAMTDLRRHSPYHLGELLLNDTELQAVFAAVHGPSGEDCAGERSLSCSCRLGAVIACAMSSFPRIPAFCPAPTTTFRPLPVLWPRRQRWSCSTPLCTPLCAPMGGCSRGPARWSQTDCPRLAPRGTRRWGGVCVRARDVCASVGRLGVWLRWAGGWVGGSCGLRHGEGRAVAGGCTGTTAGRTTTCG